MRDRRQKMFNYVLAGGLGGKRTKRKQKEVKTICVLSIESLFWGKKETLFSMLSGFVEGQNFSGWFWSTHFLCLSIKKKSTHLYKESK